MCVNYNLHMCKKKKTNELQSKTNEVLVFFFLNIIYWSFYKA